MFRVPRLSGGPPDRFFPSDPRCKLTRIADADLGGLVGNFTPAGLIDATFNGTAITIGQNLTQAQASNFPTLTVNPVENQTVLSDNDVSTCERAAARWFPEPPTVASLAEDIRSRGEGPSTDHPLFRPTLP